MHQYGVRDVEKLLRLPRSTIRSLIDAGFVTPARGPRNSLRFSFQDLIVLRTARALTRARVPPKRITHWQADTGQYLLEFDGDVNGSIGVFERPRRVRRQRVEPSRGRPHRSQPDAQWSFEQGLALERKDPNAAARAYASAISANRSFADAYINLGRLLHEHGQLAQAERVYRSAIAACSGEALLQYNLGVLLEDMGRKREALRTYEGALRVDPDLIDCLHNLALLCDELGEAKNAIRHMAQYRRLTRTRPR